MILVADCSALIALATCNALHLNDIEIVGSLGVLLAAKQAGFVDAVRPYVLQMTASDIYLTSDLIATVLEIAGER